MRSILVVAVLTALGGVAHAQQNRSEQGYTQAVQRGHEGVRREDWQAATDGYGEAASLRPRSGEPVLFQAMMLRVRGDLAGAQVAHPGDLTTATLVLRLWQPACRPVAMDFAEVGPAVRRGDVAAGVIIHEGQLTYADEGFHLVEDFGEWWHAETGLPLPLGANAIRSSP